MIWNRDLKSVPSYDVTRWYTQRRTLKISSGTESTGQILQMKQDGRIVVHSVINDGQKLDLAGGRTYQWTLMDKLGNAKGQGSLTMPDQGSTDLRLP